MSARKLRNLVLSSFKELSDAEVAKEKERA
jgi:hypothetical protein